jgi:alkanesulfonate monooxygenase SsuD/methylene tetrahydromethanopterin reductase-like flavin-dependent oxidoreductase (luciferase family)
MRVSLNITNYTWPGSPDEIRDRLAEVAAAADRGGIDTIWVNDHLLQAEPGTSTDEPMLEAYTTLGFLASQTTTVCLGTMVTAVTFRPATLLIKAVTTLDMLSAGRAWLGIGAGYHSAEADAMGLPLPPEHDRFELLADTLTLARRMWSGARGPFQGGRLAMSDPVGSPLPVRKPGPRVLIGGMGEKRTLPLVAEHGDACNLFDIPDGGATITRKLDVLKRLCELRGRPFGDIAKTVSTRFDPTTPVQEFAGHCRSLAGLGIDHVVCITTGPWTARSVEMLAVAAGELATA